MTDARPRRFGFLMFPAFEELDLVGPWEMATMWRDYAGGPECLTVSQQGGPVRCAKGLRCAADHDFTGCPELDYLLVPGGLSAFEEMNNPGLVDWLHQRAATCQHVLSVCTGAFILHAAGLLRDRRATTHWLAMERLSTLPGVEAVDQRWLRDGNVWTSAGVSAGIDLLLAFIESIDGAGAAHSVQKNAEYYPDGRIYGDG
ncbi:MAG: DJ-1/PfpI family protein [Alphaproteobacteria bacterium]|nr:DJ-1/PfpI family protein [Alphaproteobacteria bacterium]MDP6814107.1 DJ-1/PfpI family protein [Alphaproteobacteria bacterium]